MSEQAQAVLGRLPEILAIGDRAQFQKGENRDRIAGGLRAVVVLLHAQNQVRGIARGLPEATVGLVVKLRQHRLSERQREFQVLWLECRLVKVNHAAEQVSVGIEQLHIVPLTFAPTMIKNTTADPIGTALYFGDGL